MKIENYIINHKASIKSAMKKLDSGGIGFLCIYKADAILGIITDGDFRRAILNGISLDEPISKIINTDFLFLEEGYTEAQANTMFKSSPAKQIPVVFQNKLIDILTEERFYNIKDQKHFEQIDADVVIMAGGKGTRLAPFTQIIPKPLIPIGDKSMIETIMAEFAKYGMEAYFVSVNYKAGIIKAYLEEAQPVRSITYIHEDKPLGTAGALQFVKKQIRKPFFVANCDVLIKSNYADIYNFHQKENYDITLIASMQHYEIPYGVCEISKGGKLEKIVEKPEYDFLVNTGMYVLSPKVLDLIPENTFFHITDLVEKVKANNGKIGVFPISEKSWVDIGQMDDYLRIRKRFIE